MFGYGLIGTVVVIVSVILDRQTCVRADRILRQSQSEPNPMLPFEWFALFRCCVFYAGGARELLFALQERMPFRGKGYQPSDLNPLANQVMKEVGIDTPAQRPRSVAPTVKERFGCVIAICDTTKERSPIFPFTLHLQHWSILNPSNTAGLPDQKTEVFRRVREEIEDKVGQFITDRAQLKPGELSIV